MIAAFIDDSGCNDTDVLAQGGLVIDVNAISCLSDTWNQVLLRYGVSEWHSSAAFNRGDGQYVGMKFQEVQRLANDLMSLILDYDLKMFVQATDVGAFNKVNPYYPRLGLNCHTYVLQKTVQSLIVYSKENVMQSDNLAISICPSNHLRSDSVLWKYWKEQQLSDEFRKMCGVSWISILPNSKSPIAQAADLVAYHCFRLVRELRGTNNRDRLIREMEYPFFQRCSGQILNEYSGYDDGEESIRESLEYCSAQFPLGEDA